jgi:membrane associated rhomboid family serine protease
MNNESSNWTMKLIIINVVIYILQIMTIENTTSINLAIGDGRIFQYERSTVLFYGGLTPYLVITKGYVWQFVSYMFLHNSSGMMHIFFNMYALLLFGMPIEQKWGSKKFLFYYFFTGIGAGLTIFIINLIIRDQSMLIPTIGASGAVFGMLLAFGVLFPNVKLLLFFFIPIKAKHLVILYGGIELMLEVFSGKNSSISHIGHLGGLFFGLLFFAYHYRKGIGFKAKVMKAKLSKEDPSQKTNSFTQASAKQSSLVDILKKLKATGPSTLTDDEFQHIKYMDIMHENQSDLCVEDDFDLSDNYCDKCENINACLMREIKKYL